MNKRLILMMLCILMLPALCMAEGCPAAQEKGEGYTVQPVYDTPAPDASYANALLIGDSIAGSIGDYNAFPALEIEAYIGISPAHAHKGRIIRCPDGYHSMYELTVQAAPEKLFVMLGSNGLVSRNAAEVLPEYHALLDDLILSLPDTEIYLLSVTPVSPEAKSIAPRLVPDNIAAFNAGLLAMAEEHGVYYIDLCADLLDESGKWIVRRYVAKGEGIHLTPAGIDVVVETIRRHTNP